MRPPPPESTLASLQTAETPHPPVNPPPHQRREIFSLLVLPRHPARLDHQRADLGKRVASCSLSQTPPPPRTEQCLWWFARSHGGVCAGLSRGLIGGRRAITGLRAVNPSGPFGERGMTTKTRNREGERARRSMRLRTDRTRQEARIYESPVRQRQE